MLHPCLREGWLSTLRFIGCQCLLYYLIGARISHGWYFEFSTCVTWGNKHSHASVGRQHRGLSELIINGRAYWTERIYWLNRRKLSNCLELFSPLRLCFVLKVTVMIRFWLVPELPEAPAPSEAFGCTSFTGGWVRMKVDLERAEWAPRKCRYKEVKPRAHAPRPDVHVCLVRSYLFCPPAVASASVSRDHSYQTG